MINRLLGLLLFCAILGIIALNFKPLLTFGQTQMIQNAARPAIEIGNWEKAIEVYENGLKEYPDNTQLGLKLAWLYQQGKQPEKAETFYKELLQREPDNLYARLGLAGLLRQDASRVNEAVNILRPALANHAQNADLLSHLGNLYKSAAENPQEHRENVKQWLYDTARYYYQLSLQKDPKQFHSHFNLGNVYQNLNKLQPSAQAYCQAILLNPASYEARFNLGLVLSELNFMEAGYRQLDASVKILADSGDMDTAQEMAQHVQNVKNRNYHDASKHGLGTQPTPPFLNPACLSDDPKQATKSPD